MGTWNIGNPSSQVDWTRYHPWRAPGYAPVVDPCGVAGAYKKKGDPVPPGSKLGDLGSKLPKLKGVKTEWTAGGVAEVGSMMGTNHGGGYVYSLCPAGEAITEECFQRTTLKFIDNHHTIRYLDNGTQFDIPAVNVNEGTWPQGSTGVAIPFLPAIATMAGIVSMTKRERSPRLMPMARNHNHLI